MMLPVVQHVGPLLTGFGLAVAVPGLDPLLQQDTAAFLRGLLVAHGLLLIRAVPLTPFQQVVFSRGFGVVEVLPRQPSQLPDRPEIFRVSNRAEHGLTEVGCSWHSDGAYLPRPREISIFHIVSVPDHGGETQFVSLHAAFNAAHPDLLGRLRDKESLFDTGVVQPIIRAHPVTGRPGFYVKLGKSRRMQGVDPIEGESLFREIESLLDRECRVYTHRWLPGDIIVADNFSVAHRAREVPSSSLRVLHRTTIVGGGRITD
jgi:taurine dioxygenase